MSWRWYIYVSIYVRCTCINEFVLTHRCVCSVLDTCIKNYPKLRKSMRSVCCLFFAICDVRWLYANHPFIVSARCRNIFIYVPAQHTHDMYMYTRIDRSVHVQCTNAAVLLLSFSFFSLSIVV